jgi:hypothetical protein
MPILNMIYWATWWGGWWQPWANTIAYYPFTSDFSDASGNNRNLTQRSWTSTITTSGWVSCVYVNGSKLTYNDNNTILPWTARTANMRVKFVNQRNEWLWGIGTWWISYWDYDAWGMKFQFQTSWLMISQWDGDHFVTWISTNTWTNLVLTQEWASEKVYVNWTLASSFTVQSSWSGYSSPKCIAFGCKWAYPYDWNANTYFSECIFENKVRTADEILAYYNQTKSNYWL